MWAALGKALLKGGAKKVATNKILNRKKKTKKRADGKEVADNIMNKEKGEKRKKGGALAVRPSMGLVATAKDFAPVSTTPGESDIVIIKKQLIQVKDILKDTHSAKLAERVRQRKSKEADKREVREDKLEKVKPTKPKTGIKMPKMAANIGNFFAWLAFGVILNSLWKFLPKLLQIGRILGPIAKFIAGAVAKTFEFIVGFIELAYAGYDKLEKLIEDIGGEEAVEKFHRFSDLLKVLIQGALAAAAAGVLAGNLGKAGAVASLLGKGGLLSKLGLGALGTKIVTAAKAVPLAGAAKITLAVTAASGLSMAVGEGNARIMKLNDKFTNYARDAHEKSKNLKWWDPRKYFWGVTAGVSDVVHRLSGGVGGLFDIIGTPFRLLSNLVRVQFAPENEKEAVREKITKEMVQFDGRLREQYRRFFNMFDITQLFGGQGVIPDEKGSLGAFGGEKGSGLENIYEKKTIKRQEDSIDMRLREIPSPWTWLKSLVGKGKTETTETKKKEERTLTNRFDIDTGKAYINNQEVSADEYSKFINLSKEEKLDKYGIIKVNSDSEDIIFNNTQSKAEGLDTHPSYAQGSMMIIENTTTYIQPIEV